MFCQIDYSEKLNNKGDMAQSSTAQPFSTLP